ncbi:tripartite tricarboxylate transporter substrate binding protein [Bradyrhizobium sp. LHD-71]|uniref:tripartite tricarboxylate transporter substrate binding protein n=1 Tax=Bradyrhizobium sp. LHD-71 TaxID=3072141 RepID=UPI00280D1A40|nr:tripartite tricarboxylate transporter substrate binding protein [Bradyrhizobium sp. LHD-71]MDQ8730753.1 tripartite tricarboxylate transporter substrate binding protein [Bradyrhizobium sp. LHD-71]
MPNFSRRQVTALLGGGLLAPLAAPSIVRARSTQPIFIVVPYAGGGTIDNLIRTVAKGMSEKLERPVLVDNKPGGNGIVGAQYVAQAPKDGTVLLAGGTGPISLNVMLRKNLSYKLKDFTSVALLCTGPLTLTVNTQMPVDDVKGFVAYAKSRSKPLFYATLGPGSVSHLYGIIMSQSMGFTVTDVAYRNNPSSIMDLLSGECDLNFATPSAVIEHVKAGKLKILALSTPQRIANLPDIPTFAESGYPQLTASFWTALHAPAGTPPEMITQLNEAANVALKTPEIARLMEIESQQVETGPPALLDSQLEKDVALWGRVIKAQNIVLE